MKKIKVSEIFTSIQGESSYQGIPFFFIRLSGCNLSCTYCDTRDILEKGEYFNIDEIVNLASKSKLKHVEITGGEPLLQNNVYELIDMLIENDFCVLVETNGSRDISKLNKNVIVVMDIKCPSSGMADYFLEENLEFLKDNDEVKFVMSKRDDYDWAKKKILQLKVGNIIFSPVYKVLDVESLAKWIIEDKLHVRLQIQLHKYLNLK